MEQETELKKAALMGAVQIEIANIKARAQSGPENSNDFMNAVLETQEKLLQGLTATKKVVRGDDGRIVAVETVQ